MAFPRHDGMMRRNPWFYAIALIMSVMSGTDAEGDFLFMIHSLRNKVLTIFASTLTSFNFSLHWQADSHKRAQIPWGSTALITQQSTYISPCSSASASISMVHLPRPSGNRVAMQAP